MAWGDLAIAAIALHAPACGAAAAPAQDVGAHAEYAGLKPAATPGQIAKAAPLEHLDVEGVDGLHRAGSVLLAGQPTRVGFERLRARGVDHVIDLRDPEEERDANGSNGSDERTWLSRLDIGYEVVSFIDPEQLTDSAFDRVRQRLAKYRSTAPGAQDHSGTQDRSDAARASGAGDDGLGRTEVLVHAGEDARVGAVWIVARVLDEGVPWDVALGEARRVGLDSPALENVARNYIFGAGKQALGAVKYRVREQFPSLARISAAELETRLGQPGPPPALLDVRAEREVAVSHLQGARRTETVAAVRALHPDVDTEIVVYCSVGMRSGRLGTQLMQAGYTNVRNLEGSLFEWANTDRPVFRGADRTPYVHPFDAKWGQLLESARHPR